MVQTQFCDVTLEQHLKRMQAAGLVEVHGTTWGGGIRMFTINLYVQSQIEMYMHYISS